MMLIFHAGMMMIRKMSFNFKLKLLHFYNKILKDEIPQPNGNNRI